MSWATDYYEREIDLAAVEEVFSKGFSEKTAKRLNKERDISELKKEISEIGFNS